MIHVIVHIYIYIIYNIYIIYMYISGLKLSDWEFRPYIESIDFVYYYNIYYKLLHLICTHVTHFASLPEVVGLSGVLCTLSVDLAANVHEASTARDGKEKHQSLPEFLSF